VKFRLRLRLLLKWYLGHFEEVRLLRKAEAEHYRLAQALHQELAVAKRMQQQAEALANELHTGLVTMTEARLNADKHSDAMQRTVAALSLSHESAINNLKQTVDCFSLASCGRQVFGTAPSVTRQLDEQAQQPVQAGIQGRKLVQQQTQEAMQEAMEGYQTRLADFMREAEKRIKEGEALPGAQPEYSSTARAL
jgi:hypothetical protein